jgi:hypothetical protein
MRFGVFHQAAAEPGRSHADRYTEMIDLIALADEMGFDVAWLAELHFGGAFSLLAQPLMAVPAIAARTRRIRIGTAVTLLPLRHPLECAEQAAVADILSGGRLEFGVGRGSIPSQFHGFRVPLTENRARFDEALEIIRRAWTEERFSYRGRFYQVEELAVVPRPVQRPHPPIRVAVHTLESFAHVAEGGLPIYSGTTTTPLSSSATVWRPIGRAWPPPAMPGGRTRWRSCSPCTSGPPGRPPAMRCGPASGATTRTSMRSSRRSPRPTASTCRASRSSRTRWPICPSRSSAASTVRSATPPR